MKWSSTIQHVLLFADKRKVFLVYLFHRINHVDLKSLCKNTKYKAHLEQRTTELVKKSLAPKGTIKPCGFTRKVNSK